MRQRGFTLIELVIVVALIALLMALAVPGYRQYVSRAVRSEAMTAMTRVATAQERFLFTFGRYSSSIDAPPGNDAASAGLGLASHTRTTVDDDRYYSLQMTLGPDELSYELSAQPVGVQAGDACGVLTLSSAGVRGAARDGCW